MTDRTIGRYVIKEEIGQGGMATVYLASDPRFERDVAIKVLPPHFLHDIRFRARFEREARIVAGLQHPAIVPVYDFGEEEGQPYLVMTLMTGGSLDDRLREGPMPPAEIERILGRLCPALDAAHQRGIVHRDLKPANILFDQWNEPYLTDFGIVKLTDAEGTMLTTTGGIIGTPAYMSPEQVQGQEIDGRSDIYALGVILFQMLTRQLPYNATTPIGLAYKHVIEPIPQLHSLKADLPIEFQAIIDKAMAKQPGDRYQKASELAKDLHRVVYATESPPTRPASPPIAATVALSSDPALKSAATPATPGKIQDVTAVAPAAVAPAAVAPAAVAPAALAPAAVAPAAVAPAAVAPAAVAPAAVAPAADREATAGLSAALSPTDVAEAETAVLPHGVKRGRRGLPVWIWGVLALLLIGGGFALFQVWSAGDSGEEPTTAATPAGSAGGSLMKPTVKPVTSPTGELVEAVALPATAVATPQPTPSETPPPAATGESTATTAAGREQPTVAPVKTAVVIASPTPVVPRVRIVTSSANIRSGPGMVYAVVGRAAQGDVLEVIGRDERSTWYNVLLPEDERGWVAADVVEAIDEGTLASIPVAATIPAPPPTATPIPPTEVPTSLPQPVATEPPPGGGDDQPTRPPAPPTPAEPPP